MKKYCFVLFIFIFLTVCGIPHPAPPLFGGKILLKNISSYNLYIVLETIDITEILLLIEKNEQICINHVFYGWDMEKTAYLADPGNYYTNIYLYDLDSGILLYKSIVNSSFFEITYGSVSSNNAVFQLLIENNIFGGIF